ncbi:MAG: hypothetical protein ACREDK_03330 [Thermoplasmata archaeon]
MVSGSERVGLRSQWMMAGRDLLAESETIVRQVSVRTAKLPLHGNSSKLLSKFNRVRRATNPVTFLGTLVVVLEEIAGLELLWNHEIPKELESRRQVSLEERRATAALRSDARRLVRLAPTISLYNRSSISAALTRFPGVEQAVLGAIDRLPTGGPDAERQCLVSCRSAIESLCIQLGGNGDWKASLKTILPADSDQKPILAIVNFLGSKIHGGHAPTRGEAEGGLRLTIAVLESLAGLAPYEAAEPTASSGGLAR